MFLFKAKVLNFKNENQWALFALLFTNRKTHLLTCSHMYYYGTSLTLDFFLYCPNSLAQYEIKQRKKSIANLQEFNYSCIFTKRLTQLILSFILTNFTVSVCGGGYFALETITEWWWHGAGSNSFLNYLGSAEVGVLQSNTKQLGGCCTNCESESVRPTFQIEKAEE